MAYSVIEQRLADHLDSGHVSRVVYGSIIGLAIVLALEAHPPAAAAVAGTLVATAVAVGLADLYSDILGVEARERRRAHAHEWRDALHDATACAFGVGFPAVLFVLASAGVIELQTAFDVAVWSGLGLIGVYGYLAARLRGAGRGNALLHASAAALIAGVLIALKALVH